MKLESIQAVIRPRSHWEAIDLGVVFLRHWAWQFYPIWILTVLPWILLIDIGVYYFNGNYLYATFIIWWLKPLFDRIALFFFSRALFGEYPTLSITYRTLPHLIFNTRLFLSLSFERLGMMRSFHLPIWQLEQLRGWGVRKRRLALQKNIVNYVTNLTAVCVLFNLVIYFSFLQLITVMFPIELTFREIIYLSHEHFYFLLLASLFDFLILSIIEPLYVACGFSLYINQRTLLEGWDIELVFRRLQKRFQTEKTIFDKAAIGLVAISLSGWLMFDNPAQAATEEAEEKVAQAMANVLQQPEFQTVREGYTWEYKHKNQEETDELPEQVQYSPWISAEYLQMFALAFEIFAWLLLAFLIAVTLYYAKTFLPQSRATSQTANRSHNSLNAVIPFEEMHYTGDIGQQSWQLWQAGEKRKAISFLYQGTLYQLREQGVSLQSSDTEQQCVNKVINSQSAEIVTYFQSITQIWQYTAYANQLPDENQLQTLSQQWAHYFTDI